MAKLFISYAMEDGKEAGELHRILSLMGFACFLAHRDIRKGQRWRDAIIKSLRSSDVFIPLLSDHGLSSAWVQQECGMAHILAEGRKRKPVIIPVVPNGKIPPGCLSEYQGLMVKLTFWRSKLELDGKVASGIGGEVVRRIPCLQEIKPRAIANLKGCTTEDFCVLLEFLHTSGDLSFSEFLSLVNHGNSHSGAYKSDFVMSHLYGLLNAHIAELKKYPEWVVAWNRLSNRHAEYKEEERRREAEYARKLLEQMESPKKPEGGKE